jgi:quinol monooxygenase YgiN
MADIRVVGVLAAKPGSEHLLREAMLSLLGPTRDEPGCIAYDLFASDATFGTYITVETWRSKADLDAHLQSKHVQAALASASDLLASPPAIHPLVAVAPAGTPHPTASFDDDDVAQEATPERSSG